MHFPNFEVTTLFVHVAVIFPSKNRKFAPARETPLALSIDSNFIFLRFLGRLPKFLLPDLSLLAQFLGDHP